MNEILLLAVCVVGVMWFVLLAFTLRLRKRQHPSAPLSIGATVVVGVIVLGMLYAMSEAPALWP